MENAPNRLSHVGLGAVDLGDIVTNIESPRLTVPSLDVLASPRSKSKDIFAVEDRKAWDKSVEARCDFSSKLRITCRSDVVFISLWKKSVYGRTLTDIKSDESMVDFFADNIAPLIVNTLGPDLTKGSWCVVTTPKRRHKEKNFATLISEKVASTLGIPFYEDCAFCHSKHRVGAVFTLNVLPKEQNIIVFDDFVTTGQTLHSMKVLLSSLGKNCVFFAGINNKL